MSLYLPSQPGPVNAPAGAGLVGGKQGLHRIWKKACFLQRRRVLDFCLSRLPASCAGDTSSSSTGWGHLTPSSPFLPSWNAVLRILSLEGTAFQFGGICHFLMARSEERAAAAPRLRSPWRGLRCPARSSRPLARGPLPPPLRDLLSLAWVRVRAWGTAGLGSGWFCL